MKEVELIVLSGPSTGDRFKFQLNESGITIGRLAECDLVLQDPQVSRKHGKLFLREKRVMLSDLGSSHGTLHMGFRLEPGDEKAREILPGEEFKLGGSLFKAEYTEEEEPVVVAATSSIPHAPRRKKNIRKLLLAALSVAALVLLGLFLFGDDGEGFPAQRSSEKISIPDKKTYGFIPDGDRSHAEKVQYEVPTSDNVIEYDFTGGDATQILLDGVKVEKLPATGGSWEPRMFLVRDPLGGKERLLVFNEETNHVRDGRPVGKLRRWGIRNMRYTSLPVEEGRSADDLINGAYALAEQVGRSNDSLFKFSRALQKTAMLLLRETGLESAPVPIELESPRPDPELTTLKLGGVVSERRSGLTADAAVRHLQVIVDLIGMCEAELWRKFTVEVRQALSMSKAKDYIGAHDKLLGIQTMIGDEDDYRYKKALELLDDKKIVPPKIRKNPGKFRVNTD